tara:strand:+ start:1043 stop:1288 length:246 start_codon:yes stop_codon:yes gene_type:complete
LGDQTAKKKKIAKGVAIFEHEHGDAARKVDNHVEYAHQEMLARPSFLGNSSGKSPMRLSGSGWCRDLRPFVHAEKVLVLIE